MPLPAESLFHPLHALGLRWTGGAAADTLSLPAPVGPQDYEGFLGRYHPWRNFAVTVFALVEWNKLRDCVWPDAFDCDVLIVTDNLPPLPWMLAQSRFPVFTSVLTAAEILAVLWRDLPSRVCAREVMHGTVVSVFGKGILFRGPPGVGKSALALNLLQRGHRLIADDAPEIASLPDGELWAFCPVEIYGRLHVRQLGLLDVFSLFGKGATVMSHALHAVISLVEHSPDKASEDGLLFGSRTTRVGYKNNMVEWVMSARHTHEPAVWVETCARTLILDGQSTFTNENLGETTHR